MLASRQMLMILAEGNAAKVDAYLREREAAAKGADCTARFRSAVFG